MTEVKYDSDALVLTVTDIFRTDKEDPIYQEVLNILHKKKLTENDVYVIYGDDCYSRVYLKGKHHDRS